MAEQTNPWCEITKRDHIVTLSLTGEWSLDHLPAIRSQVQLPHFGASEKIILDGSKLERVDTAGAMAVYHLLQEAGVSVDQVDTVHFNPLHLNVGQLVKERLDALGSYQPHPPLNMIQKLGKSTIQVRERIYGFIAFVGETWTEALGTLRRPHTLRFKELFVQLELVCVDAMPIIALVTFLIGVVIAYLSAIQIEQYGANIFIVDGVAIAMCRELSPIIVAIIVAGRSGSAFTAHIGTMKLNEEIDALRTFGLSPIRVLVLPRLLALMATMPLLVFIGDVIGIIGGMLIAKIHLGITGVTFIERLQSVLPIRSFYVGLIKAPVFAAFIATIGCRMGLSVENNARSLGFHTTSTVVQSLVAVIILNALFAVIFVELGI